MGGHVFSRNFCDGFPNEDTEVETIRLLRDGRLEAGGCEFIGVKSSDVN
jgi:hypothetical protein